MSTARLMRTPTSPLKPIVVMPRPVAAPVRVRRKRPAWQRFVLVRRKELVLTLLAVLVACVVVPYVAQGPARVQVTDPAPSQSPRLMRF